MRSSLAIAALALATLSGCAAATASGSPGSAGAERTDPATLKATGPAQRCLLRGRDVSSIPAPPNALMFRQSASRWYRNDLRAPCPQLDDRRTLVFRSTGSQVCELDLVDVVDLQTGTNFGTCSLGAFTPVEVPRGTRF